MLLGTGPPGDWGQPGLQETKGSLGFCLWGPEVRLEGRSGLQEETRAREGLDLGWKG